MPKSTLWYWFRDITLSEEIASKLKEGSLSHLTLARNKLLRNMKEKRKTILKNIEEANIDLPPMLLEPRISMIALAMLFWAEGSKRESTLTFGNSDPKMVKMFLLLLRNCYKLEEEKFRCTVQCRADQNVPELERFWSEITAIPLNKFYKPHIDKRTAGKPTKKSGYRGVCRINYFSSKIARELCQIPQILSKGH